MNITVLIPTYRRSKNLARCCLEAIEKQTRSADEVVVVVRDSGLVLPIYLIEK